MQVLKFMVLLALPFTIAATRFVCVLYLYNKRSLVEACMTQTTKTGSPSCNTGNVKCCDEVGTASNELTDSLGLLGIVATATDLVGFHCASISVIGIGGKGCQQQTACCTGNTYVRKWLSPRFACALYWLLKTRMVLLPLVAVLLTSDSSKSIYFGTLTAICVPGS